MKRGYSGVCVVLKPFVSQAMCGVWGLTCPFWALWAYLVVTGMGGLWGRFACGWRGSGKWQTWQDGEPTAPLMNTGQGFKVGKVPKLFDVPYCILPKRLFFLKNSLVTSQRYFRPNSTHFPYFLLSHLGVFHTL